MHPNNNWLECLPIVTDLNEKTIAVLNPLEKQKDPYGRALVYIYIGKGGGGNDDAFGGFHLEPWVTLQN